MRSARAVYGLSSGDFTHLFPPVLMTSVTLSSARTPRPQKIVDEYQVCIKHKDDVHNPIVCRVDSHHGISKDEKDYAADIARANAKLIAAAPDLLEACEEARKCMVKVQEGEWRVESMKYEWAISSLLAAIAKTAA